MDAFGEDLWLLINKWKNGNIPDFTLAELASCFCNYAKDLEERETLKIKQDFHWEDYT